MFSRVKVNHRSIYSCIQSRSQSFVPLDQRSENESSGSNHFEITLGNNRILVIRLTTHSQSASISCYGACLKWLLPELSFSDRWSRATKLWERDCLAFWIRCVVLPWQWGWLKARLKKWFLFIVGFFSSFAHFELTLNPFCQHCSNKIMTWAIFVIRHKLFSLHVLYY